MKFSSVALSDLAYEVLSRLVDEVDGLGLRSGVDLHDIEKAEFALHLKRGLAGKKKRIIIDVTYSE